MQGSSTIREVIQRLHFLIFKANSCRCVQIGLYSWQGLQRCPKRVSKIFWSLPLLPLGFKEKKLFKLLYLKTQPMWKFSQLPYKILMFSYTFRMEVLLYFCQVLIQVSLYWHPPVVFPILHILFTQRKDHLMITICFRKISNANLKTKEVQFASLKSSSWKCHHTWKFSLLFSHVKTASMQVKKDWEQ